MKPFENSHRLGGDDCAQTAKDYQNTSINDYYLWNTYESKCDDSAEKKMEEFVTKNHNLWYRNGYGVANSCHIEDDSKARLDAKVTHEKAKIQLFTRFYQANPDLSRGTSAPSLESRLVQGDDTTQIRQCNRLVERDYERFVPLLPCLKDNVQNEKHIVFPDNQAGANSRVLMRDAETLKKCGYVQTNGNNWTRNNKTQ
jgi:hypothetical protein